MPDYIKLLFELWLYIRLGLNSYEHRTREIWLYTRGEMFPSLSTPVDSSYYQIISYAYRSGNKQYILYFCMIILRSNRSPVK